MLLALNWNRCRLKKDKYMTDEHRLTARVSLARVTEEGETYRGKGGNLQRERGKLTAH